MAKYRISISIDGENFFWIVVNNGKLIKNPIKEDLYGTKLVSYSKMNICPRCIEEKEREGKELTDKSILYPHNACRDKYREKTYKWICLRHYNIDHERYNPKSRNNIIKSIADHRTGNLDPDSAHAKADLFQELTCKWRSTVSTIPVTDLNKENDNYEWPIDHSRDSELGIIDSMGRFYNSVYRLWPFANIVRYRKKGIDHIICYCASENGETIERIYIIPKKEFENRTSIGIFKSPTDSHGNHIGIPWHEKYRIKDEDALRKVNKIWKEIIKKRPTPKSVNIKID